MILGLAGKTGAGKNAVAVILEDRGFRCLDLDPVAHQALRALSSSIAERFGKDVLTSKGDVDRRILGAKVFSDPRELQALEQLTYPWIEKEVRAWFSQDPLRPAAVHGVNLHKTELVESLDAVLWISAPRFLRIRRVMERDLRSKQELEGRFAAQKSLGPKLFSSRAETLIVRNSGNPRALASKVDRALHRLGYGRDA